MNGGVSTSRLLAALYNHFITLADRREAKPLNTNKNKIAALEYFSYIIIKVVLETFMKKIRVLKLSIIAMIFAASLVIGGKQDE